MVQVVVNAVPKIIKVERKIVHGSEQHIFEDALAEGQVCYLRGLLQLDPAPRNAQSW
jgi:hypothetical protein